MTTAEERQEQQVFENEVRRIARELWPAAEYSGAAIVDGRERDGVFEADDVINLIEATVSRSREKAKDDIRKLETLARRFQRLGLLKPVACWFITRAEPTAEQREIANKTNGLVKALSFLQFQAKLINAGQYLAARINYPFGSVRHPATGKPAREIEYVSLDIIESGSSRQWSVEEVVKSLCEGGRFVLLGDYGAGKSMTLRELFSSLQRLYLAGDSTLFPIYLNLRDHIGQPDAAEVLERHARLVGFSHPSHLVRAWRAGHGVLLLDGFDEIAATGIQGLWKLLKDVRFRALQSVRDLIRCHPTTVGLIVAGREHFFDSPRERSAALGITSSATVLTLNEFSDEQIAKYLISHGMSGEIPAWMPSRPLLIGYLAASGVLKELVSGVNAASLSDLDPAQGWNVLLDRVCERESEIEAGIDGPTVRRILERLSTYCRATQRGLGPITPQQLLTAFQEICGYQPVDKALTLLQRLPGLGIERPDEETRAFVNDQFADACRAGDVSMFCEDPFGFAVQMFKAGEMSLDDVGIGVAQIRLDARSTTCGKLGAALDRANKLEDVGSLLFDLVRLMNLRTCAIEIDLVVNGLAVDEIELSPLTGDMARVGFRDCYFGKLLVDPELDPKLLPRFASCYFGDVDGRASEKDLPAAVFDEDCEFGKFSEKPETTDAIQGMSLPVGTIVMLTVLKKVFFQSGSGRKENALHRGLDHQARRLVPAVLHLLQKEGLISPYKRAGLSMKIWHPDRTQRGRVGRIIASPRTTDDPLVSASANIH